jgi:predicted amidohydrolase
MVNQINVALAQISCKVGDKTHNIRTMATYITNARKHKADAILFPELSVTGYVTKDRTYELAETIPGPSTKKIEKLAKENNIHVIHGMIEKSAKAGGVVYNTAVLTSPNGVIGYYRKIYMPTHSVFEEKRYFRQGYETPVFDTQIGKVGIIICYDIFFPEIVRLLRLKGAEVIVCISASPSVRRNYFEILTAARALENTAYVAYVNLVGIEDGLQFWGGSRIIAPNGRIIAQAKYDEEDLILGTIDYTDIPRTQTFVPTLRDLRSELFNELGDLSKKL